MTADEKAKPARSIRGGSYLLAPLACRSNPQEWKVRF